MSNNNQTISLNPETFVKQFKPLQNHIDTTQGINFGFVLYELDYVREFKSNNPNNIWTLQDCEGKMVITNGYHIINRAAYILTEISYDPRDHYQIKEDVKLSEIKSFSEMKVVNITFQDLMNNQQYDNPDDFYDWYWIKENATFVNYVSFKLGNQPSEYMLNLANSFDMTGISSRFRHLINEARLANYHLMYIHQNT